MYKKKKTKIVILILIGVILISAILGTLIYAKKQKPLIAPTIAQAQPDAFMQNFFTEVEEITEEQDLENYYEKITINLSDEMAKKDNTEINITEELNIDEEKVHELVNSSEEEVKEYFEDTVYVASIREEELVITNPYQLKTIILIAENLEDTYGAMHVAQAPNNIWFLQYDSYEHTKKAYENLKGNKDVKNVVLDSITYSMEEEKSTPAKIQYYDGGSHSNLLSWGVSAMGLHDLQEKTTNNSETTVAVIDTGCLTTHIAFNGRIEGDKGKNCVNAEYKNSIITGMTSNIHDGNGHGTHVTGIITEGTCDNVSMIPIKSLDDEGIGTETGVIAGMYYAAECNADVINMSTGIYTDPSFYVERGQCNSMAEAEAYVQNLKEVFNQPVQYLTNTTNNIVICAAAGNMLEEYDPSYITVPACCDNVIAVSALKQLNDALIFDSEYSHYGQELDFAAPGTEIMSCWTNVDGYEEYSNQMAVSSSGTSMASPHVAAAAALVKSYNPDYTVDEVYEILKYYSTDLGTTGWDQYYGWGYINFNDIEICDCECEECSGIYCTGCHCANCTKCDNISNIQVTAPTKTIYSHGDTLNLTGATINISFKDNTTVQLTMTQDMITESDGTAVNMSPASYNLTNKLSKTLKITVGKYAQTFNYDIEIINDVTGISVTTNPTKTDYIEGENFDTIGMTITATYKNGTTAPVTNYQITNGTNMTENQNTVTITYTENGITKTTTCLVNVSTETIKLDSISIKTNQTKMNYNVGDTLDVTGLTLTATYSDNTTGTIISGFVCTPTVLNTAGTQTITVSYTEKEITKTTTFTVTVENVPVLPTIDNIFKDTSDYETKEDIYISNVKDNTTIEDFIDNILDELTAEISYNNEEVTDGLIGTGMIVTVTYGENEIGTYTVIILGDNNGDGYCDIFDLSRLKRQIVTDETLQVTEIQKKAMDTNQDGYADILDLSRVKRYIVGTLIRFLT